MTTIQSTFVVGNHRKVIGTRDGKPFAEMYVIGNEPDDVKVALNTAPWSVPMASVSNQPNASWTKGDKLKHKRKK